MSGIEVGYRGQSPELIDVVNNNNKTASRMPKSGGDKNMPKNTKTQFSDLDKVKHYSEIISDNNSTNRQRGWAKMRLGQLAKKMTKQTSNATTSPMPKAEAVVIVTPEQHNAFNAGIGYGAAKVGARVPIKDENKPAFRGGVKRGKAFKSK